MYVLNNLLFLDQHTEAHKVTLLAKVCASLNAFLPLMTKPGALLQSLSWDFRLPSPAAYLSHIWKSKCVPSSSSSSLQGHVISWAPKPGASFLPFRIFICQQPVSDSTHSPSYPYHALHTLLNQATTLQLPPSQCTRAYFLSKIINTRQSVFIMYWFITSYLKSNNKTTLFLSHLLRVQGPAVA